GAETLRCAAKDVVAKFHRILLSLVVDLFSLVARRQLESFNFTAQRIKPTAATTPTTDAATVPTCAAGLPPIRPTAETRPKQIEPAATQTPTVTISSKPTMKP